MSLQPPALSADVSTLADWMELQALSSPRKLSTESDIMAISHVDDDLDTGSGDSIEADEQAEELVDNIFFELDRRCTIVGKSYPFTINPTGTSLALKPNLSDAQYTYLFCLLVSEYRRAQLVSKSVFSPLADQVEDLFQICSTIAAAGLLNGCAISFGFPRPDGSGFLDALKRTFEEGMREGEVVLKTRHGVPPKTKDGGIDIIAWRHFPDDLPGKLHLLGQCASGNNYDKKPIRPYINNFFQDWFNCQPASPAIEALFIPFMMEESYTFRKDETRAEGRHGHYMVMARTMGVIVDRLRLAHLVDIGMNIFKDNPTWVQRAKDIHLVRDWVIKTEATLTTT